MSLHNPARPSHTASAGATLCDCQAVTPMDVAAITALSIRATSTHVQRKLALLLSAHDVSSEIEAGGTRVSCTSFGQLDRMLAAFLPAERPDLLAAPWADGRMDAWQIAPLEQWIQRLSTPWFGTISNHLTFYLQPIVDLGTGGVYGYEALVQRSLSCHS